MLLRVENRINFTEYVRPACLRTDESDVPTNTELLVTGWGTISAERKSTEQSFKQISPFLH